jgi:hypothetical protein
MPKIILITKLLNFQCYNNLQHGMKIANMLNIKGEAIQSISRVLTETPGIAIERIERETIAGCDFLIRITTPLGSQTLACETKARAYPSEIISISVRLKRLVQEQGDDHWYPVLIIPYFSKQAVATCMEVGISCVDIVGNCQISTPGVYIKIEGIKNPYHRGRDTLSLYSPKSAQIIHALLLKPEREWTVQELAYESKTSLGQVSSVKKLLEMNNWIASIYGKTKLVEPQKLLDDWLANYKPRRKVYHFYTLDDPAKLERRLSEHVPPCALTEYSAADKFAPYSRYQRVSFYVSEWSEEHAASLDLLGGDGASNVTVYEVPEAFQFCEEVRGYRCVSPILTYLDLMATPGRSQDAAEHLLNLCLLPRWK